MGYFWKSKVPLAKIETTYATDPTPTGSANAILCTNIDFTPMAGESVSRNLERPYFGGQPQIPVGVHAMLSFDVELQGSGTAGTKPNWGVLMRGCAVAETVTVATKVEYTPVTNGQESLTLWLQIGPNRHPLTGARGTFVAKLNAQGIPVLSFTFTGLFNPPTPETAPTPDYSGFQAPLAVNNANTPTFTIGATDHILRTFEFNRNAQVAKRFLPTVLAMDGSDVALERNIMGKAAIVTASKLTSDVGNIIADRPDYPKLFVNPSALRPTLEDWATLPSVAAGSTLGRELAAVSEAVPETIEITLMPGQKLIVQAALNYAP